MKYIYTIIITAFITSLIWSFAFSFALRDVRYDVYNLASQIWTEGNSCERYSYEVCLSNRQIRLNTFNGWIIQDIGMFALFPNLTF